MDYIGAFFRNCSQNLTKKVYEQCFQAYFGSNFYSREFKMKNKDSLCNIDDVTVFKVNSLLSFILYMKSYCQNAMKMLEMWTLVLITGESVYRDILERLPAPLILQTSKRQTE